MRIGLKKFLLLFLVFNLVLGVYAFQKWNYRRHNLIIHAPEYLENSRGHFPVDVKIEFDQSKFSKVKQEAASLRADLHQQNDYFKPDLLNYKNELPNIEPYRAEFQRAAEKNTLKSSRKKTRSMPCTGLLLTERSISLSWHSTSTGRKTSSKQSKSSMGFFGAKKLTCVQRYSAIR